MLLSALLAALLAQDPGGARWIWGPGPERNRPAGESCRFTKTIELLAAPREAILRVASDDHFRLLVNGKLAGSGDSWQQAAKLRIAPWLLRGRNELVFEARNGAVSPAALLFFGEIEIDGAPSVRIESDPSWTWEGGAARDLGPYGTPPWLGVDFDAEARFEPLPGFRVETVAERIGSLIALTLDGEGNPIVSDEAGGLLRVRDGVAERIDAPVRYCQGLLSSRGALFAAGIGPQGAGLYRIDGPGSVRCLGRFIGEGGEHGAHGIVEGPDGRLYVAIGNHHQLAEPASEASPYGIHGEDHLLPRYVDPLGHAVHCKSPGGTVASVDRDGKEWRLFAGGFRNHYDLSFDRSGNLFAFDSDMEWDIGLPWYRPVRVVHVVPGGEYGWRTGSTVRPEWMPDTLPAAVESGRGSPTGTVFYGASRFPPRFRGALLAGDWSQGQILAFHLESRGASFGGSFEVLLSGRPLNVTDLEVDRAGNLLFTTGGRGSAGGLYRLVYDGPAEKDEAAPASGPAYRFLDERTPDAEIVRALASDDRFVRYAGARAIERCEPARRASIYESCAEPRARAEALLALVRAGGFERATADALTLAATNEGRLAALRALELILLKRPDACGAEGARSLLARFPTGDRPADRELALLLAHLHPDGAVEKLTAAIEAEPSRAEQIWLAYCLRAIPGVRTPEEGERIVRWLLEVRKTSGGDSFAGYLAFLERDIRKLLPRETAAALDAKPSAARAESNGGVAAPRRDLDTVLTFLQRTRAAPRRSPVEGALVFRDACARCHSLAGRGARVGPDLTTAAARFSLADLLEATIVPSKQISDQYRGVDVLRKNGTAVSGLAVLDDDERLVLLQSNGEKAEIRKDEIAERARSTISTMPDGLLDASTLEEIGDLFAFLTARAPAAEPAASKWTKLFDGKTLDRWEGDPDCWHVESGAIVGRAKGLPGSRFLVSKEEHSDFLVEFDVKLDEGNSGLQFRAQRTAPFVLTGYQADIGESYWGSLYEEGGRGMLAQPRPEIRSSNIDLKGFNHYLVEANGDRLRIEVNGLTMSELRDSRAKSGFLGFQLHAGGSTSVAFRNVRIRTP